MSARGVRDELLTVEHHSLGRVLMLLPVIPEDAPYRIREGIARRRLAAVDGECPCGAKVDYNAVVPGGVNVAEVLHTRACPADTDRLVKAVRRWVK